MLENFNIHYVTDEGEKIKNEKYFELDSNKLFLPMGNISIHIFYIVLP